MLKEYLEWDVRAWSQALPFWERSPVVPQGKTVLDLGSRSGGLSLYFARQGARVICSDLGGPSGKARELIRRHGLEDQVRFENIDATSIDLPDGGCDIVCFKSILGGIGRDGNHGRQDQAIQEIHRVLRPGGTLFFAENLAASSLHKSLRRAFIRWGASWNYLTPQRLRQLLGQFQEVSLGTWGYFSAFGRTETQRSLLSRIDTMVIPIIPDSQRYIAFGYAIKSMAGTLSSAPEGE